MQHDKTSVEQAINSKDVATEVVTQEEVLPTVSSTRGVGHSWTTNMPNSQPSLFGEGGWRDEGQTALIRTSKNIQVEDSLALSGQGERVIDENIHAHNISNANTEFNFSQYKGGFNSFEEYGPRFTLQVPQGDINIKIDPYSSIYDETTQALGAVFNPRYKLDGASFQDQSTDSRVGVNPFNYNIPPKSEKNQVEGLGDNQDPEIDDEEEDISYYYNDGFYDPGAAEDVNRNLETGLRKANTRTAQSKQLARVAKKEDIMKAFNEASQTYGNIVEKYFKGAAHTKDDNANIRSMLRQGNSKFYANQMGVNDVSRSNAKIYKRHKKDMTTKLNAQPISV